MINKKRILGRLLAREIHAVLKESDFSLANASYDEFNSKPMPHLGVPYDKLFDMFVAKITDPERKEVLTKYQDYVIREGRLIDMKRVQELIAIDAYDKVKGGTNGKVSETVGSSKGASKNK